MIIQSIDLENYRNYQSLHLDFHEGTHIFYGNNAQGKTNLIEALYLVCTNKSYRGAKDRELIRFGNEEGHIRVFSEKKEVKYRIDMHLRNGKAKGIAVNGVPIRKASEFLGILNAVIFSPEDLQLVKEGPQERRKFIDTELCQLDKIYLNSFLQYKKALEQRNQLLKDLPSDASLTDTLDVWDEMLLKYGKEIIRIRRKFIEELHDLIIPIHSNLTGKKETVSVFYENNVSEEDFEKKLKKAGIRDFHAKTTTVGPHRDDMRFFIKEEKDENEIEAIDARIYGSQGQQRTAALALKLAEIELVKKRTGDNPVLFLDDVLSELDSRRQQFLLENLKDIQTFITCTGLDGFVEGQVEKSTVYKVSNGEILNG